MPLRIGINALYLIPGGVGGTEIYLRSLLAALAQVDAANQYVVYTNRETEADLVPAAPNFLHVQTPVRAVNRPARILYEQTALPWRCRRDRIDVCLNPGFTAPLVAWCPQVTVIHDLQHKRHPEYFRWFDLQAWRMLVWGAVRRSAKLIAVSTATREDLQRYYGVKDAAVVEHGVDDRFFAVARERTRVEPLVLCVSTLHPHKNIERLVRVFARLAARRPELRLVLAGMKGLNTSPVEQLIASLGIASRVDLTGWIPREELYGYFRRAAVFVYPSTFEGFGMPVVEALAANVPLVCSNIDPLRGIVRHAAWLFDPEDEADMERAIERLLASDLPPGPNPAHEYSWTSAAQSTLRVLCAACTKRFPP
ncbi:MAG: glycosyltransferase family 4 protein [Acidobacteria bacterium]|nr:glycosyltransferase family 4 protein [Acidobacteriota bacterium]